LARAAAVADDAAQANQFATEAQPLAASIADAVERRILESDLESDLATITPPR
jgi:hypothetical protein